MVESNQNHCVDVEGKTLYRRDPYSRFSKNQDFCESWCELTDNGKSFKWKQPSAPRLLKDSLKAHSIYEMHVGTFTPEGKFKTAASRLDHVASLGFTCIELMPITEYGGSWGYNPRSCLAIHSPYGTPDEFREFVAKVSHVPRYQRPACNGIARSHQRRDVVQRSSQFTLKSTAGAFAWHCSHGRYCAQPWFLEVTPRAFRFRGDVLWRAPPLFAVLNLRRLTLA